MSLRTLTAALAVALISVPAAAQTPVPDNPDEGPLRQGRTAADFDGDGRVDVALGAPGEAVGRAREAGAVQVVYGSSDGLTLNRKQLVLQGSAGVPDTSEAGDRFGAAVAAGDFDRDGYDDLIVGAPGEDTTAEDTGQLTVLYGSATGLGSARAAVFTQGQAGVPDSADAGDALGSSLAAGRINLDARVD